jgi:LEA14-like dessication related protein
MISNSSIKWGLGAIMVGVFGVALTYIMQQVKKLVNTEWSLIGTQVKKISLNEINIILWWRVLNDSDFSFEVSNQVFDVYLNGTFIKKVGFSPKIQIPTNSDSRIPTNVFITPKELLSKGVNFLDLLVNEQGRSKLFLEVKGTMDLAVDKLPIKKIPFAFKDSVQNIMNY